MTTHGMWVVVYVHVANQYQRQNRSRNQGQYIAKGATGIAPELLLHPILGWEVAGSVTANICSCAWVDVGENPGARYQSRVTAGLWQWYWLAGDLLAGPLVPTRLATSYILCAYAIVQFIVTSPFTLSLPTGAAK